MPLQLQGNGGVTAEVDDSSTRALRAVLKPLGYSTLGHYRACLSIVSIAAQTANARIAVLRNNAANLIIPTRAVLRAVQVAAGTAQENALDVYKLTGFTVLDTTGTATPTAEVKRVSSMAAAPGGAQLRTSTAAGGMTGATSTKGPLIGALPYNVAAAISTTGIWGPLDVFDDVNGTHPLVLAQNEGLLFENRTLNVTSYGIRWYIDLSWAEVATY
jgi:hypothetical protein